jgi:hypothetical protein
MRKWPFASVALFAGGLQLVVAVSCSPEHKAQATAAEDKESKGAPAAQASGEAGQKPAPSFVANPFCKACHLDFDEEKLAKTHEKAGIGCERCHGESLRHRSDEANVTPPELMYPKARINPTCMMCHPRHAIQQVEQHRPILEAGLSVFEEAAPADADAKKYCTDCHGAHHRMQVRNIRWDKCTGELLKKSN